MTRVLSTFTNRSSFVSLKFPDIFPIDIFPIDDDLGRPLVSILAVHRQYRSSRSDNGSISISPEWKIARSAQLTLTMTCSEATERCPSTALSTACHRHQGARNEDAHGTHGRSTSGATSASLLLLPPRAQGQTRAASSGARRVPRRRCLVARSTRPRSVAESSSPVFCRESRLLSR